MKFVIHSQTPAQKNSKSIAYNRGTGKPFIMSNKNVKDWQALAHMELSMHKIMKPLQGRQELSVVFYVKDNRRRDLDNMLSSVLDALVKANILEDDSWQCLRIGSLDAMLDKENPRAEIELLPVS